MSIWTFLLPNVQDQYLQQLSILGNHLILSKAPTELRFGAIRGDKQIRGFAEDLRTMREGSFVVQTRPGCLILIRIASFQKL